MLVYGIGDGEYMYQQLECRIEKGIIKIIFKFVNKIDFFR